VSPIVGPTSNVWPGSVRREPSSAAGRRRTARASTSAIEEDPYWRAGAWTGYTPRSFTNFVEPWQPAEIVLDGSRATTIVEGRVRDADMAEFVLIEMRGRQQIAFGGFFADGETLAICKTPDADTALGWFAESGFWAAERLRARPLLWVL